MDIYDMLVAQALSGSGGGGGGGLEIETGEWTPSADTKRERIRFSKEHEYAPSIICVMWGSNEYPETYDATIIVWNHIDYYKLTKFGFPGKSNAMWYSLTHTGYGNSTSMSNIVVGTSNNSDNSGSGNAGYPRYYTTEKWFYPTYEGATPRYFRGGHTYKWIAVWTPPLA